jgi:hypothetical protein
MINLALLGLPYSIGVNDIIKLVPSRPSGSKSPNL